MDGSDYLVSVQNDPSGGLALIFAGVIAVILASFGLTLRARIAQEFSQALRALPLTGRGGERFFKALVSVALVFLLVLGCLLLIVGILSETFWK